MTTDLQTRISSIKEQCRKAIELVEAAEPLHWQADGSDVIRISEAGDAYDYVCSDCTNEGGAFIAHSRTFTPNAARALLTLIETLEKWHGLQAIICLEELCNQWETRP